MYLAGLNSATMPLPERPEDVKVNEEAIGQMKKCASEMIGAVEGRDMEVLRASLVSWIPMSTLAIVN